MAPRVHIVHDNSKWLDPFREAFGKAGLDFVEMDLTTGAAKDLSIPMQQEGVVWFVRVSPSSHTRGARFSIEAADVLVAQLEASGATVVNGSSALALEINKAKQVALLQKAKIPSPHTVAVIGHEQLASAIGAWKYGMPFLLKHSRGGSGTGVRLFRNRDSALAYINSPDFEVPIDGITLIQQFIDSPEESLYRLEFVGGKYMYAVRVSTQAFVRSDGGAWQPEDEPVDASQPQQVPAGNNCPALLGESQSKFKVLPNFSHAIVQQLEKLLSEVQVDICGVEIVLDRAGEAFVIDMNCCNTNYNLKAEEAAGIRAQGCNAVAAFLRERAVAVSGSNDVVKEQMPHEVSDAILPEPTKKLQANPWQVNQAFDYDAVLREKYEASQDSQNGKAAWQEIIAWLG